MAVIRSFIRSMASLWKDPRTKYWQACFTAKDGRQLKRSTKTTIRKVAARMAEEFESAATKKRTMRQQFAVVANLHELVSGEVMATAKLRDHVETWLKEKQGSTAPATAAFYQTVQKKFLGFMGPRADSPIADVMRKDIAAFRASEAATLAPKSVNHLLKTVRMIFKSAREQGLITDDPTEFVEALKDRGEVARRPFTMDELRSVLAAADDEWRSMILCGIYTGQRLGDIAKLRWNNISMAKGELNIITSKTGKRVKVPLSEGLKEHLAALPKPKVADSPVHPRAFATLERNGKSAALSGQFSDVLAAAGLRAKITHRATEKAKGVRREGSSLTFHSLRHSAVTLLKEAGVPDAVVMEFVGHDSKEMSASYTHVGGAALAKAVKSMPKLSALGRAGK